MPVYCFNSLAGNETAFDGAEVFLPVTKYRPLSCKMFKINIADESLGRCLFSVWF